MEFPFVEPYKIKMVEKIFRSTREEREKWIQDASYNLFNLKSEQVFIDLLTDSGTGAMSQEQWSAIMSADESYAGSKSYYQLKEVIRDVFGFEFFLPTHQGRGAENVLFSAMVKEGDIIPGNAHFDTTKGHIEFRKAKAIDCTIDEAFNTELYHPFKGNIDLIKLENVLKNNPSSCIPMVIITATCNTAGGQPVSLENMEAVKKICDSYGIPLFIDSARFAENAWFIKNREDAFRNKSIQEIVTQMFSYADGMTMSSKKDGLVNIGGFVAMRNEALFRKASTFNIMFEGFITYGGLAGRDLAAMAVGLKEVLDEAYLESRILQVEWLTRKLDNYGIPVQIPNGGHAVFINANNFLPDVSKEEFIAQTLAIEIYIESGVRTVELGTLLADRDPVTRENRYPDVEFLRLSIPRRVYSLSHLEYVAAGIKRVFDRRNEIKTGYKIKHEAEIMRHFTVELEKIQ